MEGLDLIMEGIDKLKSPVAIIFIILASTMLAGLSLNWYRLIEKIGIWVIEKIKNIIKRR